MNESVNKYWNMTLQYWNKYTNKQKSMIIIVSLLLLGIISFIGYKMSQVEYATAFTDLEASDAASIKSYLDSAKIPYQISTDGRTIGVPMTEVTNVKLDIESKGLNKSGSLGYGAFDKNNTFGMTDNEFNVKYVNAVQGEIQQLINNINGVANSKVIISLPKDSAFLKQDQGQSSVSVVIRMKPGYKLDQKAVDTMYNLVQHSIPYLSLDNITISDQNGQTLGASRLSSDQTKASDMIQQMQINDQFQKSVQRQVQQMLGSILGPDKIVVSVVSNLNFDQKKSHQQLVQPVDTINQKGIEISLQQLQESYTNTSGPAVGGVPGVGGTDVPGYPGNASDGSGNSERNQKTVNYDVNRITNDIVSSPYTIKDLTINVGIEPPDPNDPNSLTQVTKDAVQQILVNIVRASLADNGQVYADADLNKKVTVMAHTFPPRQGMPDAPSYTTLIYIGAGVAAVLLILGIFFLSRKRKEEEQQQADVSTITPQSAEAADFAMNQNEVKRQLEKLAKTQPEQFVNLLRTWLVDE